MTRARYIGAAIVLLSAVSTVVAAEEGAKGSASVSEGAMSISVGDYRVIFVEDVAWTLRQAYYQDKPLLLKTGWQQTVINVRVPKGEDPWIGTGHGKEVVESIELCAGDEAHPVEEGLTLAGGAFNVRKRSRLGPFTHIANVTIDKNGITEAFQYEVAADASDVQFMYIFMHCFPNETRDWLACLKDNREERGVFLDDASFSLHEVCRWIAVYAPSTELGVVYAYPEPYEANGAKANMFWNRAYDNKLYFQVHPPASVGERFSYTVRLQAFTASQAEWEATARKAIEGLTSPHTQATAP